MNRGAQCVPAGGFAVIVLIGGFSKPDDRPLNSTARTHPKRKKLSPDGIDRNDYNDIIVAIRSAIVAQQSGDVG